MVYGLYTLFAYSWPRSGPRSSICNGLHYVVRRRTFSTTSLSDVDYTVDFARESSRGDIVAVITASPFTKDKDWKEFSRVHLIMLFRGLMYYELCNCGDVEREERGFFSRAFPNAVQTSVYTTLLFNQIVGTGLTATNATNMTTKGNRDIRDRRGGGGGGA